MTASDPRAAAEHLDVLVIGAGPAGLAAAHALVTNGVRQVTVIDREQRAGGVPRHCHHGGFGIRDLHRTMSGPSYAEALVRRAVAAGVRIETETMATGWSAPGVLSLTAPSGVRLVSADAVVLATGARERPRSARLVPGDRPEGIFTTGQLQQWVDPFRRPVGHRAIVVGAEHVSYSAVLTLRSAGVQAVAMVTDLSRHQTYAGFAAAIRWGLRVPLWTNTEVADIRGHGWVREVDLYDRSADTHRQIAVDAVVFTGDWIPDHELARSAGVALDRVSKGPVVDEAGECSIRAIYAAGNLVHPAETADIAALRGAAVGTSLARRLTRKDAAPRATVDIVVAAPLSWSSPGRIATTTHDAAKLPGGLILRTTEFRRAATVVIAQGDRPLARFRVREVIPHRSLRVPIDWSALVRPDGGDVRVRLE